MKKIQRPLFSLLLILLACLCFFPKGNAQINAVVFQSKYKINPEKKGELSINLDNISFFKNNEFSGPTHNGYTLPGLWLQPKLIYYPLQNIKLEAGAHLLKYWGAMKYPCVAYQGIPRWNGSDYQNGFHALPFFRAQIALSKHVDIVLGNIYGGANHRLIEPLYNPEMNLTADPEAGLQLLYTSKPVDLDIWVNWDSFIFNGDVRQESFTFGLSTQAKLNKPESKFHVYIPLQILFRHKGGEIDIVDASIQTWLNAAVGAGITYNINYGQLKRVNFELMGTYFGQQAGNALPLENGYAVYPQLTVDIYDFQIKTAYWKSNDFVSIHGSPFFSALSSNMNGGVIDKPGMFTLSAEYTRSFGEGFSLGIDANLYNSNSVFVYEPEMAAEKKPSSMSYSFGIYFRMNPSFLLKKF